MMDIRPNHTIYVNNLNEKIKKDGKDCAFVYILQFFCVFRYLI
jgi:hypothetical protein